MEYHSSANVSAEDRSVLRDLAKEVADIAALPIQAERAELWRCLNTLKPRRPVVLANPQNGWCELLPQSMLKCEAPLLRNWEWNLREKIFRHQQIHDDYPITDSFDVSWVLRIGDYGLVEKQFRVEDRGSYKWDPPIKSFDDLKRLHQRHIEVDHEQTAHNLDLAQDILGDILHARVVGERGCRCKLTRNLIHLRGLDQMMFDMYDNPELMHELMAFLRDDMLNEWGIYEREGVLSLNNGPDQIMGVGSLGHTDELPAEDFDGHVRMKDMFCWGESQETLGVGPDQFHEFVLQYQLPIMNRFGLVSYGCCEPLDNKFDLLIQHIPNLRWLGVSAWCNRQVAAEKLKDKFVYVYKPNPSRICSPTPDFGAAEKEIRDTLGIAKGCCIAIVMKDTHTFHNEPERIKQWTEMASNLVIDAA